MGIPYGRGVQKNIFNPELRRNLLVETYTTFEEAQRYARLYESVGTEDERCFKVIAEHGDEKERSELEILKAR